MLFLLVVLAKIKPIIFVLSPSSIVNTPLLISSRLKSHCSWDKGWESINYN